MCVTHPTQSVLRQYDHKASPASLSAAGARPAEGYAHQVIIALQHEVRQTDGDHRSDQPASRKPVEDGAPHGRRAEKTIRRAAQGPLRHRRGPAARPCAGDHARLGDPQGAPRPARAGDAERGGADLADRRGRGAGLCHGRRRQLQRRVGRARHSGFAARRPQASVPYRRLRCVRHRLGGRIESAALECRRRSHHSLQSGRRRRRGVQRRRSAVVAVAAHLGLRDARRLVRAILPRAVAPAHAQAAASELGRIPPATR